MKKNDRFEIFKINTSRFCRKNYNINLSYEQAIVNKEVVSLSSSELLRALRKLCKYNPQDTFIAEYLSIQVDKNAHYKRINKKGLILNGHKYIRFGCSPSNARVEVAFLIREDLYRPLFEIMSCGISVDEIVFAKWNAYYMLPTSSTFPIREPRVCVVPDYVVNLKHKFDFINEDMTIEERDMTIEDYPVWDGMGMTSVEFAKLVAEDLELDYIPSCLVLRANFIKGANATMDFHDFAKEIANVEDSICDVWGNNHKICELDMILTASQFKMWKEYKSWDEYLFYMHKYELGWGVTQLSHKRDETHAFTNYQFLQVLELNDTQVEKICQSTVDWINDITGNDVYKLMLYFLGTKKKLELDEIFKYDVKSLIYNHELITDTYIRNRIMRSLNLKIRQAYSGKLLVDGNFSFMLCDPYAFMEYVCGMKVHGLLNEFEHYNGFWNKRHVNKVCACRSPLTWASEVNILNLKKNEKTEKWYRYVNDCCTIYNIYGNDTFLHADSDWDGDKVFTTNCQEMIDGKSKEFMLPITYNKKSALKEKFDEKKLYEKDMLSFGSKIGFVTNCSTYWWELFHKYKNEKNSIEYKELIRRLKLARQRQGNEIDKSKGIEIEDFPKEYTTYVKDMTDLEKSLMVDKKPYFQKYIYPKLNREYEDYIKHKEDYSFFKYGKEAKDNDDIEFIKYSNYKNPIVDYNSTINRICHHMEKSVKEIKRNYQKPNQDVLDNILIDSDRELLLEYAPFVFGLIESFKTFKETERNINSNETQANSNFFSKNNRINLFQKLVRKKLYDKIENSIDIGNIVVYCGYSMKNDYSKDFVWEIFGEEVFANVKKNSSNDVFLPVECSEEEMEFSYMGTYYKKEKVNKK